MDHGGAEGAQSWGRPDGLTGRGGVMGLEAEVKLGDPHQRAELGIRKAKKLHRDSREGRAEELSGTSGAGRSRAVDGTSREGRAEELSSTIGVGRSRAGYGTSREDANNRIQRTLSGIRSSM